MPETSGLQVQARLREVSPDTKVIMMTGRETPAIRAAALQGGAFAFAGLALLCYPSATVALLVGAPLEAPAALTVARVIDTVSRFPEISGRKLNVIGV